MVAFSVSVLVCLKLIRNLKLENRDLWIKDLEMILTLARIVPFLQAKPLDEYFCHVEDLLPLRTRGQPTRK